MKAKKHAKDLREEAAERRKKQWRPEKETAGGKSASAPAAGRPGEALSRESEQTPEEEALAFLAYLEKDSPIPPKEDGLPSRRREKKPPSPVRVLNLEQGMPTVEEALSRLRLEIQRLKSEGAKAAKLIHGYGSTGRGGKICVGVRQELPGCRIGG